VAPEVRPRGLWNLDLWCLIAHGGGTHHLVRDTLRSAGQVGLDIGAGLHDITRDIEGVARSLRDGQTVVEGDAAWNGTESDDHTPHLVDGAGADSVAVGRVNSAGERGLEACGDDQGDDPGTELTHALHSEDGAHHGSTPLGRCELRCDDGGSERRSPID
jgi:hypothetical protein